jgi:hypothetical protein
MRPFIEKIVDVKSDENCWFRAIVESMGLTEEIGNRNHYIEPLHADI